MSAALAQASAGAASSEGTPDSAREDPLAFKLPSDLSAREPIEARGAARDSVRLMVSRRDDDSIVHARFHDLPDFLNAGDVLVVNKSATINAALQAMREPIGSADGETIALHLSSPVPGGRKTEWVVELRRLTSAGTAPLFDARPGERLLLPGGETATLVRAYGAPRIGANGATRVRLWAAELSFGETVLSYTGLHGAPIRYAYVPQRWPLSFYQTVFANEPGSAEMPSAGRAFTTELVQRLTRKGVHIAPIVLHTGVASLESGEAPYPERFRVSTPAAELVNRAREEGARVIAVGTTVVRALESVASGNGRVRAGAGWTDLVITPARGVRVVDGLLTGLHEPRSSHLQMLEALAGPSHVERAYQAALGARYLWHEFGDGHLIL